MRPKPIIQTIVLLLLLFPGAIIAQTNVALYKTATCTATDYGYLSYLTDGSQSNGFSMNNATPCPITITLDLSFNFDIISIKFYWYSAGYPTTFTVQTSPDNNTYTNYASVTSRATFVASDSFAISKTSVRYARLVINAYKIVATEVPLIISEMKVYSNITFSNSGVFSNLYSNSDLFVMGNTTMHNNLTVGGTFSPGSIKTTGSVSAGSYTTTGSISAGSFTTTGLITAGNITATGTLTIPNIYASGNLTLKGGNYSGATPGSITVGAAYLSTYPIGGDVTLTAGTGYTAGRINLNGATNITGTTNITGNLTATGNIIASSGNFSTSGTSSLNFITNATTRMTILNNGYIGINCAKPTSALVVNGVIKASEVDVISSPCSDYVFEPGYKLQSLPAIEKYISENKHLPEVPSAKEFEENGCKLGQMQDILLRKIEELTLLMIEQNKRIEALEKENAALKNSK